EVDSLDQLREVLAVALADAVLLDNMDVTTTRTAVELVGGKFPLEASGNVTLDNIAAIAATGVDYASSGWITHSAPNLDVALDIELCTLARDLRGNEWIRVRNARAPYSLRVASAVAAASPHCGAREPSPHLRGR